MDGIGSGKVIERYRVIISKFTQNIECMLLYSGPDSYVFVNFVDHGAPGIFGFPEEFVSTWEHEYIRVTTMFHYSFWLNN